MADFGISLGITLALTAVSLAASYYLKQNPKVARPRRDTTPPTLASQGAYVPYLIGRRRVSPVFAWAGDRTYRSYKKQPYTTENGWHLLCVGPAKTLWAIYLNGKNILPAPIHSDQFPGGSIPSGTHTNIDGIGGFDIYWGEEDPPINTDLGTKIGVSSRWPYMCYVQWHDFNLQTGTTWPTVEYEVETGVWETALNGDPEFTAAGDCDVVAESAGSLVSFTTDGSSYTAIVVDPENELDLYTMQTATNITISGSTSADGSYPVTQVRDDGNQVVFFVDSTATLVIGDVGVAVITTSRQSRYSEGWNPAHIIDQLLFSRWPHGLALEEVDWLRLFNGQLSTTDPEGLDGVGFLLTDECHAGHVIAEDGEEAASFLGRILQDVGVVVPYSIQLDGRVSFVPIRPTCYDALNNPQVIPTAAIQEPLPEITTNHLEVVADRMVFSFPDRSRNYRDSTVSVDEDSQASYLEVQRAQQIQLHTVTDLPLASTVAARRSQEELAQKTEIVVKLGQWVNQLVPGRTFYLEGFDVALRVTSVEWNPLEASATVRALHDIYSADIDTDAYIPEGYNGQSGNDTSQVGVDWQHNAIEVPLWLLGGNNPEVWSARVRLNAATRFWNVNTALSPSTTYTNQGRRHSRRQLHGSAGAELRLHSLRSLVGSDVRGAWLRGMETGRHAGID
jgi:hypothetical protein